MLYDNDGTKLLIVTVSVFAGYEFVMLCSLDVMMTKILFSIGASACGILHLTVTDASSVDSTVKFLIANKSAKQ